MAKNDQGLAACPCCGGEVAYVVQHPAYAYRCIECGLRTRNFVSKENAAAAWNQRADGWISVDEQLPIDDGYYNVTITSEDGKKFTSTFCIDIDGDFYTWTSPTGVIVDSNIEGIFYYGGRVKVTHWQPLPEPPTEQDQ